MQSSALVECEGRGVGSSGAARSRRIPGTERDERDLSGPGKPARYVKNCIPRKTLREWAGRNLAEAADAGSVDEDVVSDQDALHAADAKCERLRGIRADQDAETDPDQAVGIESRSWPMPLLRDRPGVVVEVCFSIAVGFAAVCAVTTALNDEVFGVTELDDLRSDRELDPYEWDASFYASIAYAGGASWESQSSAQKRRAFWEWYLNEGVPIAVASK